MRSLVHVGLSLLLIVAPTLCCCNIRTLCAVAAASPVPTSASHDTPTPGAPSCCHTKVISNLRAKSCCHAEPVTPSSPKPAKPAPTPAKCQWCDKHTDAAPPEATPTIRATDLPGDFVPVMFPVTTLPLEHLGLIGGLDPPERAGVDTRSEALFSRHVLRC